VIQVALPIAPNPITRTAAVGIVMSPTRRPGCSGRLFDAT
jgi:hypothetical protein